MCPPPPHTLPIYTHTASPSPPPPPPPPPPPATHAPNVHRAAFTGCPAKRARNTSDHASRSPTFAGASGATDLVALGRPMLADPEWANKAKAGQAPGNFVRGGLAEGFVKMSPYGAAVSNAARARAEAAKAEILKGGFAVFRGGLKDNKGNVVVPVGKNYAETAIELESTSWLVEGVIGSTS